MNKLKVRYITYAISALNADDIEVLTKFIVILANEGFKNNIVHGDFSKGENNE